MPRPALPSRILAALRDPARWRRWAFEALIVVAIVVAVQVWQVRDLPEGPAPQLAGRLADGRAVSLAETIKAAGGRPVLVTFWASWCPSCKAEEGNVAAVARDWPLLSVAMQSGDAPAVAKVLKERKLDFPVLVDEEGAMSVDWKVSGVPAHFIVDGRGIIRYRMVGYTSELGLRARLWWADRRPA